MDLPVVEVLEGDGRLTGTLGALVLRYLRTLYLLFDCLLGISDSGK